jgi:hypothetical protein
MVAPLEMHASEFFTALSQAPKVFTVCIMSGGGGSRSSPVQDPMTCIELWCHVASSAQTHLTRVWSREPLYSGFGALRSWDPMVVETWIEMLREKLKLISSLPVLDTSVAAFLRA